MQNILLFCLHYFTKSAQLPKDVYQAFKISFGSFFSLANLSPLSSKVNLSKEQNDTFRTRHQVSHQESSPQGTSNNRPSYLIIFKGNKTIFYDK